MSRRAIAVARAAATALLALSGCASGGATVCRTDIALQDRQNLVLAPVSINGQPVPAIIDTGAQVSAITESAVTRLGLLGDPFHSSLLAGVGGEGTVQNDAIVDRFELAGYDPGSGHYPVFAIPFDSKGHEPLGALVGDDMLSHFDIDLDVANGKAILYDPDRCEAPPPEWRANAVSVPLTRSFQSGRLAVDVKLDGHDLRAMIDSGAAFTVLDLPAAERLGVTREVLSHDPGGEGAGAAGVAFHGTMHSFRTLEIAGERFDGPRIAVLDRELAEADMLLGLDWLRAHHVLISFRRRVMFIARPTGVG
jgi:predicted aspartyl protease